jgi:hypothetical protein
MSEIHKWSYKRTAGLAVASGTFLLACVFLTLCLSGCYPNQDVRPQPPGELYIRSLIETIQGNYKQAYLNYQKSVESDPNFANASFLSGILYGWALSESEADDTPILKAQRQVLLTPLQLTVRSELLSVAVDTKNDSIQVFGVGIAPRNITSSEQERMLAREAALTDAYAWVARLAMWSKVGVDAPLDVSQKLSNVRTLKEYWIGREVFAVKVKAPLKKNMM